MEEYEIVGEFEVAISICIIKKLDVYIYGAGTGILALVKKLKQEGIEIKGIIDADILKEGKKVDGVTIYNPTKYKVLEDKQDRTFAFVLTWFMRGMMEHEISNTLWNIGIRSYYTLRESDLPRITGGSGENKAQYYRDHVDDIVSFGKMLDDEDSQETLIEYMRTFCEFSYYKRERLGTRYKYFYGENGKRIYRHLENERWVNCGAFYGDTIFTFFRNGLHAEKIWAVESDKHSISVLVSNLKLLPEEMRNSVTIMKEFIDESFDEARLDGGVTFINADIEGAELGMLKALKRTIQRDRPVLAICLYHKTEDIIEIPHWINKCVENYHYFLKQYGSADYESRRTAELVLYAVPHERMLLLQTPCRWHSSRSQNPRY